MSKENWNWVKPGWENLVGFLVVLWLCGLIGLVPDLISAVRIAMAYVVGSIVIILLTIYQIKREKSNDTS